MDTLLTTDIFNREILINLNNINYLASYDTNKESTTVIFDDGKQLEIKEYFSNLQEILHN